MAKVKPNAVTTVPEMKFLWDGVPFDKLGIMEFVTNCTFTTTTERQKRKTRSRRHVIGKVKVGAANITFVVPNRELAYRLNQLLIVRSRPVIAVGAKSSAVLGGRGVWIGSFKVNKINWSYPSSGVATLQIVGMNNKVMGLAERTRPRVYEGKTFLKILEDVAKDHDLTLHPETRKQLRSRGRNSEVYNIAKPTVESDWAFIERLAASAGFASMYLDTDTSRQGIQAEEYLGAIPAVDETAAYIDQLTQLGGVFNQIADVTVSSASLPKLADVIKPARRFSVDGSANTLTEEVPRSVRPSTVHAARQITKLAKTFIRIGEQPGFFYHGRDSDTLGVTTLGYGPGLKPGDDVDMLVAEIKVGVEGYKAGAMPGTKETGSDGGTGTYRFIPTGPGTEPVAIREAATLAQGMQDSANVSGGIPASEFRNSSQTPKLTDVKKGQKDPLKTPDYVYRGTDDNSGDGLYRVYTTSVPDSVSNVPPSRLLSAAAIDNSFLPEMSVKLVPGNPLLVTGGSVHLIGTYVHDGTYGISESVLKWSPETGMETNLKLKALPKATSKEKAGGDAGSGNNPIERITPEGHVLEYATFASGMQANIELQAAAGTDSMSPARVPGTPTTATVFKVKSHSAPEAVPEVIEPEGEGTEAKGEREEIAEVTRAIQEVAQGVPVGYLDANATDTIQKYSSLEEYTDWQTSNGHLTEVMVQGEPRNTSAGYGEFWEEVIDGREQDAHARETQARQRTVEAEESEEDQREEEGLIEEEAGSE